LKSEGFWVHLRTGRWIEVRDHAIAVKADPRRFRITPSIVRELSPNRSVDHDLLRLLAMRRGWLRVRSSTQGEVSAEFWCGSIDHAARRLRSFLGKRGFGELTLISIKSLRLRTGMNLRLRDRLAKPVRSKRIDLTPASHRKLDSLLVRINPRMRHEAGKTREA